MKRLAFLRRLAIAYTIVCVILWFGQEQNAFTNLRDMTKRFGLFWFLPVDLLLRQRFDSLQKISSLQMPVLFIHGNRDPQIPAKMSQTLFTAAPKPKRFILIPKGGHDNNMKKRDLQKVGKFMEEVLSGQTIQY